MNGPNGLALGRDAASPLAAVFFDFDSTLSTPQYVARARDYAVSDRLELCMSLKREEVVANFSGEERIRRLDVLLRGLLQAGVELIIISLGLTKVIWHHLEVVGLAAHFDKAKIFGQDSLELCEVEHRKALLIQKLMQARRLASSQALFVDDSAAHIKLCADLRVCKVLKVSGNGLSPAEIEQIGVLAGTAFGRPVF